MVKMTDFIRAQFVNLHYEILDMWPILFGQECIPVGCVSSAALPICGGGCLPGVVSVWGVSAQGGLSAQEGCLPRGVSGGICTGVYPSMHWGRSPPPVDRILDRRLWKHYLSATSFADDNKLKYVLKVDWNVFFSADIGNLLVETGEQIDKITRRNPATRLLKASGDDEKLKALEKRLDQMSQRGIYQILVSLSPEVQVDVGTCWMPALTDIVEFA